MGIDRMALITAGGIHDDIPDLDVGRMVVYHGQDNRWLQPLLGVCLRGEVPYADTSAPEHSLTFTTVTGIAHYWTFQHSKALPCRHCQ